MMKIGLTDGDGFDSMSEGCDIVAILIGRHEVESGKVGDVVDRLMKLSDSREKVLKFKSSVVISFSGYDADPRPLGAIPECVNFFRQVHAQWPYWYHFLVKEAGMFGVVLSMLMDTKVVESKKGSVVQEVSDPEAIKAKVTELFTPMNVLYETHGIGLAENRRMTDEVVEVLCQCLR